MTPTSEQSSHVRAAFVFEQTLGHVTNYRNPRDSAAQQSTLVPTWPPIPYEVTGDTRLRRVCTPSDVPPQPNVCVYRNQLLLDLVLDLVRGRQATRRAA